jgi:hypothetical protein
MGINSLLQQDMQNVGIAGIDRLAGNAMYPQSQQVNTQFATPTQMPTSSEVIRSDYGAVTNPYNGEPIRGFNAGGIATLRYEEGGEVTDQIEEPKTMTMAELAEQLKNAYRTNSEYEDIWKNFAATKEQDPQQWYKHQLDFLGNQVGWQIGQNTSERAASIQPQIENTVEQAKAAGLKEDEINNILASSNQEANFANQRRIAEEAAKGKGWVNQNIPGGYTTLGALALAAAAPYALSSLGAGAGTAGAGTGFGLNAAGTGTTFGALSAAPTAGTFGGLSAGALGTGVPAGLMVPTTGALAGGAAASAGMTAKQAAAAKMGLNLLTSGAGGQQPTGYAAPTAIASAPAVMPNVNRFGVTGYEGQLPTAEVAQRPILLSKIKGIGGDYTFAEGGIAALGSYSDGGQLLKGPGDGMSDNIPAKIGETQPARLADGEFVIPADVVSHLGNGSTDAGAKQLYAMMDKIRKARTGNKKQGKQINPSKFLP